MINLNTACRIAFSYKYGNFYGSTFCNVVEFDFYGSSGFVYSDSEVAFVSAVLNGKRYGFSGIGSLVRGNDDFGIAYLSGI